mgnify:CR=1 FL=1
MLIPVILGVTFLVYFILGLTPGDPATLITGGEADEATVEAVREELGLNDPVVVQYARYMWDLLHGDMGESWSTKRDVFKSVMDVMPNTLKLGWWSMVFCIVTSLPIGIISATKQYSIMDNVCMVLALLGLATPNFWLGLMLVLLFSLNLGWVPSGGMSGWNSLILPVFTLGTSDMALLTRMTRSSMLEVVRQDYIRTARAKGVSEKVVIRKHALKNALIPIITAMGLQFGGMLGGAMLTETVFSWPGIGRLMVDAIKSKDTPVVMGCVITITIGVTIINLIVDILYGFVDPRIKAQYKK